MHIKKFSAVICVLAFASVSVIQAGDTETQAQARELVRQKEAQLNGQPAPTNAPADTVPAPPQAVPTQEAQPPVPAPVPTVATPAPAAAPDTAVSTFTPGKRLTPAEQEKAREAMRKAIADLDAKEPIARPASPSAPAPDMIPETKAQKKAEAKMAATNPTAPMPPAIYAAPGSRQARLYDLLQRYERDEISPVEYHDARAKIIAEP